jgi:hypothetical protein
MTKESIDCFKGNLTYLVDLIKTLSFTNTYTNQVTRPLSTSKNINTNNNNFQSFGSMSSPFYWMLQDPIDEVKYSHNKSLTEMVTNSEIDFFNRASIDIL